MDLGQNTKAARGGNPWLVLAVMVAIVAATLAVWFATGSGLATSGALTGRPAAGDVRGPLVDDSYNAIEDVPGAAVRGPLIDDSYNAIQEPRLQVGRGPVEFDWYDQIEKPLGGAATSFAGNPAAAVVPGSVITGGSAVLVPGAYSYVQLQQMHLGATAPTITISATSGTFHAGNPQAAEPIAPLQGLKTIDNPVKRDRVGGP
jgi:hypothetical protein